MYLFLDESEDLMALCIICVREKDKIYLPSVSRSEESSERGVLSDLDAIFHVN